MSGTDRHRLVLIVDDYVDLRDSMSLLLGSAGFDACFASTGREALEALNLGMRPCVILLEPWLEANDASEFRAFQAQDPELVRIPVIVLTSSPKDGVIDPPAARVFNKPFSFPDLVSAIVEVMGEKSGSAGGAD